MKPVLFAKLLVGVAALIVVALISWEATRERIVVGPIDVPASLSERGYNSAYLAERLSHHLRTIRDTPVDVSRNISIDMNWTPREVLVPGFDTWIETSGAYLREWLGSGNMQVTGRITYAIEELTLHLHVKGDLDPRVRLSGTHNADCPLPTRGGPPLPNIESQVESLLQQVACETAYRIEPYTLVAYLIDIRRSKATRKAMERIIADKAEPEPLDHLLMAVGLNRGGYHDAAIAQVLKILDANPENAAAYNEWGYALSSMGERKAGFEKLRQATELDPKNAAAFQNWGTGLVDEGDYDQAIEKLSRSVEIYPEYLLALNNLSYTFVQVGDFDAAVDYAQRAVQLDPYYRWARKNLGLAWNGKRRFDEAEIQFREALELSPDYAQAHAGLGEALSGKGDWEGAIEAYRKAVESAPDTYDNLRARILELERLRDQ